VDAAGPDNSEGVDLAFHERDKETAVFKRQTTISIVGILTMAFCH